VCARTNIFSHARFEGVVLFVAEPLPRIEDVGTFPSGRIKHHGTRCSKAPAHRWCLQYVEHQGREALIKLGEDYYDAKGVMSIQRVFHRSRVTRFPVVEVDALRQRLQQQAAAEAPE
jgi:hypothetical protein